MATAAVEAGGMAERGERGLEEGPEEAGQAVGEDSGTCEEGPGEDAAAVVRQQPGADDGGDPRSGGVHDGISKDRSRTAGNGDATQEANRTVVCPGGEAGDRGRIPAV